MVTMQQDLTCPICHHSFTVKVINRPHQSQWMPVLLKCGHTYCEACICKIARSHQQEVECPDCLEVTHLPEEDTVKCLVPDVYTNGQLTLFKSGGQSLKTSTVKPLQFVPAGIVNLMKKSNTPGDLQDINNRGLCSECNKNPATCRCIRCDCNMCAMCFDVIHKTSKTLKRHKAVPLNDEYSNEVCPTSCEVHDERIIEYFCEDCQTAICSHCVIIGGHKGHNIASMEEKNKAAVADIEQSLPVAITVLKNLRKAERELTVAVADKLEITKVIEDVQKHFRRLHATLQLREVHLVAEIENRTTKQANVMQDMKLTVVEEIKRIEFLLKDAQKVANNQLILNAKHILEMMNAVQESSCVLVPVEEEDYNLTFDKDDSLLDEIKGHGTIKWNDMPRYTLKTLSESPEELVEEDDASSILSGLQDDLDDDTSSQHSSMSDASSVMIENVEARPRSRLWRKKPPFVKQEMVYVTHIKDPSHFMVQRCTDSDKIKQLSANINKWCNSPDAINTKICEVEKDSIVLAQYSLDNTWYRARVKRVLSGDCAAVPGAPGPTCVELFYVDYGNMEVVSIERLQKMQSRFLRFPEFVTQCCLFDIVPPDKKTNWPMEAITTFARMTSDKPMIMNVIRQVNGVLHVDLSKPANNDVNDDRPVSVRDALIFLELGYFTSPASKIYRKPVQHFPQKNYLKAALPELGQHIHVRVSHVVSPDMFFIQLLGEEADYLTDLMTKMQETYSVDTGDLWTVFCPQKGMICVAQYDDDNWYRARVDHLPGRKQVEIQYVDYGNSQLISHWRLKKILDSFTVLPAQAVQCQLVDISSSSLEGGWSQKAMTFFEQTVCWKKMSAQVIAIQHDCLSVLLNDTSSTSAVCINNLMVSEGYAVSTEDRSIALQPNKDLTQSSPMETGGDDLDETIIEVNNGFCRLALPDCPSPTKCIPTSPVPPVGDHDVDDPSHLYVAVTITQATSPTDFYLQLVSATDDGLNLLMQDLETTYNNKETVSTSAHENFKEGDFCAVRSLLDNKWCRGLLKDVSPNETAKVLLCDYGYVMVVSLSELQPLSENFRAQPAFAVHCHLAGIHAAGSDGTKWSRTACELFTDVYQDKKTYLIRKGDLDEGSLPCELLVQQDIDGSALELATVEYVHVSQVLVEQGLALPIRSQPGSASSTPCTVVTEAVSNLSDNLEETSNNTLAAISSYPSNSPPSACLRGSNTLVVQECDTIISILDNSVGLQETSNVGNAGEYLKEGDVSKVQAARQRGDECCAMGLTVAPDKCHDVKHVHSIVHGALSTSSNNIVHGTQNTSCNNNSSSNSGSKELQADITNDEFQVASYKPFKKPSCSVFPIVPTYVDNDCIIYVQESQNDHPLVALMSALQTEYADSKPVEEEMFKHDGQACVAQYSEDGLWYRASIVSLHRGQSVEVQFIDYGNSELVPFSSLRLVPPNSRLLQIPQQCYPCILHRLHSVCGDGLWPTSVIDCISQMMLTQAAILEIKDIVEDCLSVSIILSDNRSLAEVLIYLGVATNVTTSQGFASNIIQTSGKPFHAVVTHVEEPDILYMQYAKEEDSIDPLIQEAYRQILQLETIAVNLEKEAGLFPLLKDYHMGQVCCGQYTYDGCWYRGEVLSVCEDKAALLILYVDYGTSEYLPYDRVRALPTKFTVLPAQAMKFHVRNLVPHTSIGKWTRQATDMMMDCLANKTVTVIIQNDEFPYSIDLYAQSQDNPDLLLPVYQPLIEAGLAQIYKAVNAQSASVDHFDEEHKLVTAEVFDATESKYSLVDAFDAEGHLLVAGQSQSLNWADLTPGSDPTSPERHHVDMCSTLSFITED